MRSNLFLLLILVEQPVTQARKPAWIAGACGGASDGLSYKFGWSCPTTLTIPSAGMPPEVNKSITACLEVC